MSDLCVKTPPAPGGEDYRHHMALFGVFALGRSSILQGRSQEDAEIAFELLDQWRRGF